MAEHTCQILTQRVPDNSAINPGAERVVNNLQNINNPLLQPEILYRILSHLPQNKLVRNRSVTRYWRDTIDEHFGMSVVIRDGKFLDRKLQLRIKDLEILDLPYDLNYINLAYPKSLKSIKLSNVAKPERIRRLLNQVKPYIHTLDIHTEYFKDTESILTPPFVFPQLRELRIDKVTYLRRPGSINLGILFSHHIPLLKTLSMKFDEGELHLMDEAYKGLFNFLAAHSQTLKRLDVEIQLVKRNANADEQLPNITSQRFELSPHVKDLLFNGQLQLESIHLYLHPRYISFWVKLLQTQKNLKDLLISSGGGVPFNSILPGIESNMVTLRKIYLCNIVSVGPNGTSYIPFDCSVFRNAVNLTELSLFKNTHETLDENDADPLNNLGEIPLTFLKKLEIEKFVCDSGELQTLVDNAFLLEDLVLKDTQAPCNSRRFASTGAHGGIIDSFSGKPNRNTILVEPINFSNAEENKKLKAVRRWYPDPFGSVENANAFFRDFSYFSIDSDADSDDDDDLNHLMNRGINPPRF